MDCEWEEDMMYCQVEKPKGRDLIFGTSPIAIVNSPNEEPRLQIELSRSNEPLEKSLVVC